MTIWLPELTKTILSVGSLVVSTLELFLFTMLQNFGKYGPNPPTPLYFVPNNLQIYLGWLLDPPPNSQILLFFKASLQNIQCIIKKNLLLLGFRKMTSHFFKDFLVAEKLNIKKCNVIWWAPCSILVSCVT